MKDDNNQNNGFKSHINQDGNKPRDDPSTPPKKPSLTGKDKKPSGLKKVASDLNNHKDLTDENNKTKPPKRTGDMSGQRDANNGSNPGFKQGLKNKPKQQSQPKQKKKQDDPLEVPKKLLKTASRANNVASNLVNLIKVMGMIQLLQGLGQAGHAAASFFAAVGAALGKIFGAVGHAIAGVAHAVAHGFNAVTGAISGTLGISSHAASAITIAGLVLGTGVPAGTFATSLLTPKDNSANPDCINAGLAGNSNDTINIAGVSGSWTQKGTKAYNLAKAVWTEAKKLGMDDNHAAALVGNAEQEGAAQGNPLQEQIGGGGGKGIFQFTGQTPKYGWSIEGQVKSILANGDPGWAKKKGDIKSLTDEFCTLIERAGAPALSARESNAGKAYSMFNGTGGGEAAQDAADNDSTTNNAFTSKCGAQTTGAPDGSGSVGEHVADGGEISWTPDEVPSDVKQYIHDPKDLGMGFGNSNGWYNKDTDGECVPFASSYFAKIWSKSGGPMVPTGKEAVSYWSKTMKGKVSDTPHAGAIASTTQHTLTGGSSAGHTYVVLHVLSNGDAIVIEQNWPGKSGSWIHKPYTWNYALFSKSLMAKNTQFFMPDGQPKWSK